MDNYRCYHTAKVWIFKSSRQDLAGEKFFTLRVHHPISTMETQMAAHLVTVSLMVMSPSLSIPAWSVDVTLAEWVQLLQVPHLPPNFSLGIDSFGFRMIDVSSWSGTSFAAHKWYNY